MTILPFHARQWLRIAAGGLLLALLAMPPAGRAGDACTGTGLGGFLFGTFPSDTSRGTLVCLRPAMQACRSCQYSRRTSTCNNADCTTATCYCASSGEERDFIFLDGFGAGSGGPLAD